MCLLCKIEGAISDVRVLILDHEEQQRRAPCGCPDYGLGWVAHGAACRAEMSLEAAERRRPA